MKPHEFFHAYADTPLVDRSKPLDGDGFGQSLSTIYHRLKMLEQMIRPLVLEQTRLLKIAERVLKPKGE